MAATQPPGGELNDGAIAGSEGLRQGAHGTGGGLLCCGFVAKSALLARWDSGEDSAEDSVREDDSPKEERVDRREGEAPIDVRNADSVAVVVAVVGAPNGRPSLKTEGVLEFSPSPSRAFPASMSCGRVAVG